VALHPQAEAAMAQWAAGPRPGEPGFDIDAQRAQARALAAAEPCEPVAAARDVDADGVACRLYVPEAATDGLAAATVVFLHGGGFVFGDLVTHEPQARRLANRTGLPVLAVDYRRPPEHRFPAAPQDVDTAVAWLRANAERLGVPGNRLVALGDSAGGNLAMVAVLHHPDAFGAAVLVYPFLDPTLSAESYRREAGGLGEAEARWYWQQYARSVADHDDPDLAPMRSDRLGLMPPTLVVAAEHDPLVDENVELAHRLDAHGVDVELLTHSGMVHGFWRHPEQFDAAEESLAEISDYLRRTL
jgi:acetyl esterase